MTVHPARWNSTELPNFSYPKVILSQALKSRQHLILTKAKRVSGKLKAGIELVFFRQKKCDRLIVISILRTVRSPASVAL